MTSSEPGHPVERPHFPLLEQLVAAGHLIPLCVPGLYGRGYVFEDIITRFQYLVTQAGADLNAEVMHFPPLFPRKDYLKTGHFATMPHLLGSVHGFLGGDAEYIELVRRFRAGEDWSTCLADTDLTLVPAACYPLYPTVRGPLPQAGRVVDLLTFVFRREPSDDPARMQSFRQREYVRLGTPGQARAHAEDWLQRGHDLLSGLGLDVRAEPASDPFFGRAGQVFRSMRREQHLKYELVCPISRSDAPIAIASCNYHLDHFGRAFDIRTADGEIAHTACVGFGLERVALALFRTHGIDPATWPPDVRQSLGLR